MSLRIVSDSSINMTDLKGADYCTVPLRILSGATEFVDDRQLDVEEMVRYLQESKEKSSTSCPNIDDWRSAFEGADEIIAITISSNLSGSYASCSQAMSEYLQEHPGARGYIFDSLSTGPLMRLLAENAADLSAQGVPFDEIIKKLEYLHRHAFLIFALASMNNLSRNGRVPMAVAKAVGLLNIRIIAVGENGRIKPVDKCRGEGKLPQIILREMKARNYAGGSIHIDHCLNLPLAERLREEIQNEFPQAHVTIGECRGLCSYYAEKGGIMLCYNDFTPVN